MLYECELNDSLGIPVRYEKATRTKGLTKRHRVADAVPNKSMRQHGMVQIAHSKNNVYNSDMAKKCFKRCNIKQSLTMFHTYGACR